MLSPVTQQRMVEKNDAGEFVQRGDCLPACLATIFGIPLEDIPHFNDRGDAWWDWLCAWINGMGYALWQSATPIAWPVGPLCIVSGVSPRDPDVKHAVVGRGIMPKGKDSPKWELVHDPHPDGSGIVGEPNSYWYFIALRPRGCA